MSLYKDYIEEITYRKVWENSYSFIHYNTHKGVLFIKDLYIKPEYRGFTSYYKLLKTVFKLQEDNDCDMLAGYVHIDNPNKDKQLGLYKTRGCSIHPIDKENRYLVTKTRG